MDLLRREVPASSLVAIDPGKALNRVWLTSGERELIGEPVSLPVLCDGVDELERLIAGSGAAGRPVIGLEATGGLHRPWAAAVRCAVTSRQRRHGPLAAPGPSTGKGTSATTEMLGASMHSAECPRSL